MKRKYPWEDWFARTRIVLVRGKQYHCSQSTMSQTIRNNASARGLRVRLTDTGLGITVEVLGRRLRDNPHTDKAPVTGQQQDALARHGPSQETAALGH